MIIAGLVALFAVALVTTRSSTEEPDAGIRQTADISIHGSALPDMPEAGNDPAVGKIAPELRSESFSGSKVNVVADGRPKAIIFLAHWCPHCQAEVPVIQSWLNANGAPEGVDLYAVSTSVDETLPNYPPSEWLKREGWTVTTMLDDEEDSAMNAFGIQGFPAFVFVDKEGVVVGRASGELPVSTIEGMLNEIRS